MTSALKGSAFGSVCPSVCLSVCLSVYICMPVCLFVCQSASFACVTQKLWRSNVGAYGPNITLNRTCSHRRSRAVCKVDIGTVGH